MYLPPPLRKLREAIRQKQIQQNRLREFKSLLQRPVVDPISRAAHRMFGEQAAGDTTAINSIEQHRAKLLKRTDSFRMLNLASDAHPDGTSYDVLVREAATWSQGPVEARFLFHLIRALRPEHVLEMGACVGISGSYIASAMRLNGKGHLWTLEGSPEMAKLAKATFVELGVDSRIILTVGPFRDTLATVMANKAIDLAFIDGHHEGAATLRYFETIKPRLSKGAVVWFDDIDWPDMAPAWTTLKGDPVFSTTAQTKRTGLAVVR
jgi:predicted O-methyltransferase YrrM